MHKRRKTVLALMFAFAGTSWSCGYPEGPKRRFGPNESTSLIVIFRKGVSQDAINEFEKKVISIPHESGNGIKSLPGISSGYLFSKRGREFKGINFFDDATIEQRRFVKQRILASQIVACVRENVVPDDSNILECETSEIP